LRRKGRRKINLHYGDTETPKGRKKQNPQVQATEQDGEQLKSELIVGKEIKKIFAAEEDSDK